MTWAHWTALALYLLGALEQTGHVMVFVHERKRLDAPTDTAFVLLVAALWPLVPVLTLLVRGYPWQHDPDGPAGRFDR